MTSESQTTPVVSPTPLSAPTVQQVQGRNLAGQFLEKNAGPQSGTPEAQPTPSQLTLEWNGVQRTMPIQDLVRLAQDGEEASQTMAAAKQLVAKNAVLHDIGQHLERHDPETREKLLAAIRDPRQLTAKAVAPPAPRDPFGESEPQANPFDDRLRNLEQGVTVIANAMSALGAERQHKSNTDRVDALMNAYPALRDSGDAMKSWAKDDVMMQLASNPQQDLEKLVLATAKQAQAIRGGSAAPIPFQQNAGARPPVVHTAADLESGAALRAAKAFARENGLI